MAAMTEPPIRDAEQRRQALDVNNSFIVQAPAGSGKTELLTQRFLALLARVEHPEEVCAITFTRKAAAEMRDRILSALDRASAAAPEPPHQHLTWQLANQVRARDAQLGWRLDLNPNRLRIQTFDSLALSLARQMPLLSTFGATPGTTEQAEPLYREAARSTLRLLEDDRLGPSVEQLLVHLDNRRDRLEDLLCNMLARRDQWLPHVAGTPDGRDLDAALANAICEQLRDLRRRTDQEWLLALCDLARWAAGNLSGITSSHPLLAWYDSDELPGDNWTDLSRWQGLADILLTQEGEPRKKWDMKLGFPAPSEKGLTPDDKAQRKQAKDDMQALANSLREHPDELTAWRTLRLLPHSGLDESQHAVLRSLYQVLLHAVAELGLVFRDSGEVDFVETQIRAQRALGAPDSPTDLALALDYRLQHLLVDEFQDTSSSQHRLLSTLTAAWQRGDGRTLFVVGDPMQSIYRFREAEVGLFLAARESGIGQIALRPLTLQVNFRSTPGVIDWVNRCFATLFPSRIDIARGAVSYAHAVAFNSSDDGTAVQVHPFVDRDDPAEADRVVALIQQALQETADGQVAVLARARSHLHAIAGALKRAGQPFQAVEVDPLAEQPVVRDLYHLTRALLHPGDRLAWLVVLRAPWLGLCLPDLLNIAEDSPRTVLARLRDAQVIAGLSDDGRHRVARLLSVVDDQLPARGRRPLRAWIEGTWRRLGGAAVAGPGGLDDAQTFLALLDAQQIAAGLLDFAQLEAALTRLYAAPDIQADGRVQLMTMHKAKGLEFDTVILPGLGRKLPTPDSELLYWLERTRASGEVDLLMAPIRSSGRQDEPITTYLRALERDKSDLETTRLLYVAATRAKRRLHLLSHITLDGKGGTRPPAARSLLAALWPVVEPVFDALDPPRDVVSERSHRSVVGERRLAADWQLPRQPGTDPRSHTPTDNGEPVRIDFDWAGDAARHVGTLVHRYLERIAKEGLADWPATRIDACEATVRLGLLNLGTAPAELDAAVEKTLRALRRTLTHDTGRWLLGTHLEDRCEWPLTAYDGGPRHYVIDRSFVDEQGIRWIIDYKTGEHLAEDSDAFLDAEMTRYREQLDTYAGIVRRIDARPIRLALYFPLMTDWRVWNFAG